MRSWGFSLIELMVTVAVLAILVAIGLPSFQGSMRSNRVATGTNEFVASLSLARSEAIRSPGGAGICATTNGTLCNGDSWNDGWLVWSDLDGSGEPGGANDRVLRHVEGIAELEIEPGDADVKKILFDPRGRAGTSLNFTIQSTTCPEGQALKRDLTLTPTGQLRVERSQC